LLILATIMIDLSLSNNLSGTSRKKQKDIFNARVEEGRRGFDKARTNYITFLKQCIEPKSDAKGVFKRLRGEKIKGEAFDPLYKLSRLHLDQHHTTVCQLDTKSKGVSLNIAYYAPIRKHLATVYNQLPQDLQVELLKQSTDKEQQQQRQLPTTQTPIKRPKFRKIDLEDEDTLMNTPQQPSQPQPLPQQQQQPSSSSRQQQQQSSPKQLSQQQPPQQQQRQPPPSSPSNQQQQPPQQQQQPPPSSPSNQQQPQSPQQQPAAQPIVHSVPDDANLNDALLQHCQLLADQMSSIAAAAASTQNIILELHLPTGPAGLNIQSLEAICKLASLKSSVDIRDYLWGKNYLWYGLSPKLIKSSSTRLKPDGFCMYRAIVAIQKLQSAEEEGNGRSSFVDLDLTKAENITELLSCVQRVEKRASIDLFQQRCKHLAEKEIKDVKVFAQQAKSLLEIQLEVVSKWE
jgi:hypothetical protein